MMKALQRLLLFLPVFCIVSCALPQYSDDPDEHLKNTIKTILNDENLPSLTGAIIDSSGVMMIYSSGLRNSDSSSLITSNDLFHLGSCTKAMTSTMLATLVADGKLSWESTIEEILPELSQRIHVDFRSVKLNELVKHRAGLSSNVPMEIWGSYDNKPLPEQRIALIQKSLEEKSDMTRGDFSYSNLGYIIAGTMAEKVTNESWETLMKKRVFDPLEMKSASYGTPGSPGKVDQPWGHEKIRGEWIPSQVDNPEFMGPAGTVHCTVEDWAKFISLFLKKKESILSNEQIDILTTPEGEYANGWFAVNRSWANGITYSHSGSNTLWFANVWVAPKINRAFVALSNSGGNPARDATNELIGKLITMNRHYFGTEEKQK